MSGLSRPPSALPAPRLVFTSGAGPHLMCWSSSHVLHWSSSAWSFVVCQLFEGLLTTALTSTWILSRGNIPWPFPWPLGFITFRPTVPALLTWCSPGLVLTRLFFHGWGPVLKTSPLSWTCMLGLGTDTLLLSLPHCISYLFSN